MAQDQPKVWTQAELDGIAKRIADIVEELGQAQANPDTKEVRVYAAHATSHLRRGQFWLQINNIPPLDQSVTQVDDQPTMNINLDDRSRYELHTEERRQWHEQNNHPEILPSFLIPRIQGKILFHQGRMKHSLDQPDEEGWPALNDSQSEEKTNRLHPKQREDKNPEE